MLYTRQELAEYLRVTTRTVDKLVASGAIPVIKVGAASRYRDKDIEKYLTEATVQRKQYTAKDIYPGIKYVPGMKVV